MGKWLLRPGLEDDLERFLEAFPTLAVGHAIPLVGSGEAAASNAEIQASLADLIDRGGFFGDTDRVAQRQHIDGDAHSQALRTRGDGTGDGERGGDDRRDARALGVQRTPARRKVTL